MKNPNRKKTPETIEVQRRRQGGSSGPESRARAEAPRRPTSKQSGGGTPLSSGGGYTSSSGGGGSDGNLLGILLNLIMSGKLPVWAIILLVIAGIAFFVFISQMGGDLGTLPAVEDQGGTSATYAEDSEPATIPPSKFTPPAGKASGETWLVMLYQDADDQILEQDIYLDLNEAERVGSSDSVHIVAQIDRYRGAYSGDGNWTSARRYYVTKDDDLQQVNSQLVTDLGEVNMADSNTLIDFVAWAAETFPADHYALILSDHGMGWPGGWSDATASGKDKSQAPLAAALEDNLYLMELDGALEAIRQQAGIQSFDLIGMDACLMSHLEVLAALQPYARYAVLSQETEPALGWAYTSFLEALVANPGMSGSDLSRLIVDSYIDGDQRIVDDEARADFLRQGSPLGGLFGMSSGPSAEQLAQQMGRDVTLTAADLGALPALMSRLNEFVFELQNEKQSAVARSRGYAQSFTSVFGDDVPPSYLDLGNFIHLLQKEADSNPVNELGNAVLTALEDVVVAEKHGKNKPGATGISIYFPNASLYENSIAGAESYTSIANRFAETSLWDDFLAFHYTNRPFEMTAAQSVVPGVGDTTRSPGAGEIRVEAITQSSDEAAPDQPVTLSTIISGKNVGYVYLFVGYYDQASNSIFVADTDYLESPDTREVDGVYYPKWSEDEAFTMKLDWEPTLFSISDGQNSFVALFTPQQYGASFEDAIYTVDGTYTYAESGEARRARLLFRNGALWQVFGFNGNEDAGAPREITPQVGDTFTVFEKWMTLDENGQPTQTVIEEGQTLTFNGQPFVWEEVYAAAGEYRVGFLVADLDGNAQEVYVPVTVR